jgi:transcription elongation GreA/GreB family factor
MSVAFRRDGDDEHLEPKFEIPIPPGPNLVTVRGLALIGEKLAALEVELAAKLADAGEEAQINAVKRQLRYWTTRQITAELVPAPDGSVVAIGTRVSFTLNGKRRDLAIVGDDEADPAQGSIAFSAPLARALIGGEEGEFLPFNGKEDALEVLEIAVI